MEGKPISEEYPGENYNQRLSSPHVGGDRKQEGGHAVPDAACRLCRGKPDRHGAAAFFLSQLDLSDCGGAGGVDPEERA